MAGFGLRGRLLAILWAAAVLCVLCSRGNCESGMRWVTESIQLAKNESHAETLSRLSLIIV